MKAVLVACPGPPPARRLLPGWKCSIPYELGVKLTIDWFSDQLRSKQRAGSNA